ncbi:hypothetical protein EYZ11_013260 [Aspergillus tanneri]|uniref:Uncharacterized protein n=1 Tax=Aspergillus tanneri TaxID=1220188 RepID=A0A4V3UMH7_9EURO|nr:uncharacterized protein ATNIH1004_011686 [Aspergillus tanneri]KAA8641550.1 hypothetical protein ATNIH1004_011686 [Aspergillus tanneri]THC87294.1 hypothetical protein EYZ11_013260 [Aspergillus tanneri]
MENSYIDPRSLTAPVGQGQAEVSAPVEEPTTQRARDSLDCPRDSEKLPSPSTNGQALNRDSDSEDTRSQVRSVHVSGIAGSAGSDLFDAIPPNNHLHQPYVYDPYYHFYPSNPQQNWPDEQSQPPSVGQPETPWEIPPATARYLSGGMNLDPEAESVSYLLMAQTSSMCDTIFTGLIVRGLKERLGSQAYLASITNTFVNGSQPLHSGTEAPYYG